MNIAVNVSKTDIDKAISMADSLAQHSESKIQSMRSYLLLAMLHEDKGDFSNALSKTIQTQKIAISDNNHEYQVRASVYLATLYRRLDLIEESIKHLKNAEEINVRRKAESHYSVLQSIILHEKSIHKISVKHYREAIDYLMEAEEYLIDTESSLFKDLSVVAIYETFSRCYLQIEDFGKTKDKAEQALKLLNEQEPNLTALLHSHLGEVEINYDNYEQAYEHLKTAEQYAYRTQSLNVRLKVYHNIVHYYKVIDDFENIVYYKELITEITNKRRAYVKEISNELLENLYFNKEEASLAKYYLTSIADMLLFFLLLILILGKRKNSLHLVKYRALIERLEGFNAQTKEQISVEEMGSPPNKNYERNSSIMTQATENRLLNQLNKMEKANFYLNTDISLSSMASDMNSNIKDLSKVIEKHKKSIDFNSYIEKLRIYYIINQFDNQPESLKYKLSHMADRSGFVSNRKFTNAFKSVTGLRPYVFIRLWKRRKNFK